MTFQGRTLIGGPLAGVVAEYLSARYALGLGAPACLAAAVIGVAGLRRLSPAERRAARRHEAAPGGPPELMP